MKNYINQLKSQIKSVTQKKLVKIDKSTNIINIHPSIRRNRTRTNHKTRLLSKDIYIHMMCLISIFFY